MTTILILVALAGGDPEQCRRIHYTADGRVIRTTVGADEAGATASTSMNGASANGSTSSSSSVSVSSSSNGSSSATSSSSVDGVRRSTTVKRDGNGCTITVDDRPVKE